MLRKVLLMALLGVCCGFTFEQSLKFSPLRKGIHRFAMDMPKKTQKLESAVDQLQGNPNLLAKLEELRNALLLKGQPLGGFSPDAFQPFSGPLTKPSYQGKNEVSPGTLKGFSFKSCSKKPEEDRFVINKLLLKPDPVEMPGELTFDFNIDITQDIDNLEVALNLSKKVGEQYIKIPCIGQFGSCTYDVCQMLTSVESCPQALENIGFNCQCPFQKGSYIPKEGITAMIEAAVFPSGDYMVYAQMTTKVPTSLVGSDEKVVEAGCYIITLSIA